MHLHGWLGVVVGLPLVRGVEGAGVGVDVFLGPKKLPSIWGAWVLRPVGGEGTDKELISHTKMINK